MITLSTLNLASEQEIFDQAARHLIMQGEISGQFPIPNNSVCKYRIEFKNGEVLKCAAGCFISKDEYKKEFERNSWPDLIRMKLVPDFHGKLIHRLQQIHDKVKIENWIESLYRLANEFKLNPDFLEINEIQFPKLIPE